MMGIYAFGGPLPARIAIVSDGTSLRAVLTRAPHYDPEQGYELADVSTFLAMRSPALMLAFRQYAECVADVVVDVINDPTSMDDMLMRMQGREPE